MHNYRLLFVVFFIVLTYYSYGQLNLKDSVRNAALIYATYSYQFPLEDMASRFGSNSSIGGGFMHKMKNNWLLGTEANFLFGRNVKEDSVLGNLINSNGVITGSNSIPAEFRILERGFKIDGKIGKIIPKIGSNVNSGIALILGIGLLQHKIRIEDVNKEIPALQGNYLKGYDKLSNGLSFSLFAGYLHLDNRKLINFFIGPEIIYSYTQNRRDYDFALMRKLDENRNDLLFGFKAGWIFPLYIYSEKDTYYF